jgi:hypothetical protein
MERKRRERKRKGRMRKKKKKEEEESDNPAYCVLKNVFLDVMPCDLVEISRRFRGAAGGYSKSQ